jgi:Asp-tRNA(Asn)/Glu-tRNA(Gln) amidotransferase A subunit family amidase
MTSVPAGRTQTREGTRCRRLVRRIGKDKAQVAAGATQPRARHKLLSSPGTRYHDLGADYYEKRAQAKRKIRYHLAELDALGYDVTLTPGQAQTPPALQEAYRPRLPDPPTHPQAADGGLTVAVGCCRLPG